MTNSLGSPVPFMSWDQVLNLQDRMNETAYALQKSPGQSADQGVGGVDASPDKRHLTVYWRGPVTPQARAIIATGRVAVEVKPAAHTEGQLADAAARVRDLAQQAGIGLEHVKRETDASALSVPVIGTDADARRLREAVAGLGVAVHVTSDGQSSIALADPGAYPDRENDPSAAGAQMIRPICSTGFTGKINASPVMFTADHCFVPGGKQDRRPSSDPYGPAFGERVTPRYSDPYGVPYDIAAIRPFPGTAFEPKMWTGPGLKGEPGTTQKTWVSSAKLPQSGNYVCNGGSRSGTTCNIRVTGYLDSYSATVPASETSDGVITYKSGTYSSGWQSKKVPTLLDRDPWAGITGDSGGPVVLADPNDNGSPGQYVTAVGIVSSGGSRGSQLCTTSLTAQCTTSMTFVRMDTVLRTLGATITVGTPWGTRDIGPGDMELLPATKVPQELYDRVTVRAENGAVLGSVPQGRAIGTDPGRPGTVWNLQLALDTSGTTHSLIDETYHRRLKFNNGDHSFNFVHIPSADPNKSPVIIRNGPLNACLKVSEGFRWFGSGQMLVSGVATQEPCNQDDPGQRFTLIPQGTGLSDEYVEATGDISLPEDVPGAPDASLGAAASFLAKTHDRYAVSGLGVPQSYTGGHFAPGAEFGPDGYQSSFTYDNSVMIAALLQRKNRDVARATRLGDSLLYAQAHDKVPDGRIRASYLPNPFVTADGTPYVGGFSVYTGNMAWAGMAFSRLYKETGEQRFREGALKAAEWIQTNAADSRGLGGYTGGWVDTGGTGDAMVRREWKATEHNIDVGAFFAMLAQVTGDQTWKSRSDNAFAFVRGMQADDGRLWTGTGTDGVTQNRDSVPEDVQTWSYLATLDPSFSRSVDWAAEHLAATDGPYRGVSFAKADTGKVWLEGTAHLLAAYHARGAAGDRDKAAVLQDTLTRIQAEAPNGDGQGIVAASSDGLATGEGDIYYASLHTGATAWYLLAGQGGNPFRL
ncbi:hypothetical protein ACIQOW_37105 [Kitasatospora sp. NPDC091335]|uniref:hypothetical protein n=1 Tax=Kitasatospora sp. NPDC091335 TaxID=3364085 RepID=UPI00381E1353